jgi:uncharacterized membrane protein
MITLSFLHSTNILIHVIAGSLALILGVVALVAQKGKRLHIKTGNWFLILLSIVIISGLLGVFVQDTGCLN